MIEMSTEGAKSEQYGTLLFTCYGCMEHYCHECVEGVDDEGDESCCMSSFCKNCNRRYCFDCSRQRQCYRCDDSYSEDCINQCERCGASVCPDCTVERSCRNDCGVSNIWCYDCVDDDYHCLKCCKNCGVDYCVNCCKSDVCLVKFCNYCGEYLCGECRVNKKCKEKDKGCMGCYRFAFPALMEYKERQRQEMQAENEKQREEIDQLKRQSKI